MEAALLKPGPGHPPRPAGVPSQEPRQELGRELGRDRRLHAGVGGARTVDAVEIRFLGVDERSLIAGYGGLSDAHLAELLEKHRTASV